MALLSLTMKTTVPRTDFIDTPPSPPLSSPSPSSATTVTDDNFRPATIQSVSLDIDRPLKKRRKQERPSFVDDRRLNANSAGGCSDDEEYGDRDGAQASPRRAGGRAEDEDDVASVRRNDPSFAWNDMPSDLRCGRSSPETQHDGSDKENTGRDTVGSNSDEGNDFERFADIDFRKLFEKMNGMATDLSSSDAAASSTLLQQLISQNPAAAAAAAAVFGHRLDGGLSIPAQPEVASGSPPPIPLSLQYDRPTPPPTSVAEHYATGSEDGEGMPDDGEGGPETCGECQKVFKRRVYLQRHMAREHWSTARVFKCDKCAYETKHQSNLLVHRRTHTGERPYHCGACGQRYTQGHLLKAHIRSRHGSEMAYYNMDKRSDGVRCRRSLTAMRAAAAAAASGEGSPSSLSNGGGGNGLHHRGPGTTVKEDKIRFLLEAADEKRHQQQQQHQQLLTDQQQPGGDLRQPMPGTTVGPFGPLALGQYVSALSSCLPGTIPPGGLGTGPGQVSNPSGLVRPLIWTPSLAAAAAAAAAAGFMPSQQQQQQQQFLQPQLSAATSGDHGLAVTSHAALLSSLAATPFQPTMGNIPVGSENGQTHRGLAVAATAGASNGAAASPGGGDVVPTSESSSLLSSLLSKTYGPMMRFGLHHAAAAAAAAAGGLPAHLSNADATRGINSSSPLAGSESPASASRSSSEAPGGRDNYGQAPEDLSISSRQKTPKPDSIVGGGLDGVDNSAMMQAAAAAAAAAMPMMNYFPIDLQRFHQLQLQAAGVSPMLLAQQQSNVADDCSPLNLAKTMESGRSTWWSDNEGRMAQNGSPQKSKSLGSEQEATDLSAPRKTSGTPLADNGTGRIPKPSDSPADFSRHRKFYDDNDVDKQKNGPLPAMLPADVISSPLKKNIADQDFNLSKQSCELKRKSAEDTSSSACCVSASDRCPHLKKLKELRRNVYRMLTVFTPYLDVSGAGIADVETDSVDDFLHEVIYSSKLGSE